MVTPHTDISHKLTTIQLLHWLPGMGSAPTVMQALVEKEEERPIKTGQMIAARKLTYSGGSQSTKQTMMMWLRVTEHKYMARN